MPRRPWRCYRRFDTPPYTRKEYIRSIPHVQIPKFTLGNIHGKYNTTYRLIVMEAGQISQNALEAARLGANAVVGVDFETSDLLGDLIMVSAHGTAVIIEPEA